MALVGIGCLAIIALLLRWIHHPHPPDAPLGDDPVSASAASTPAPPQLSAPQHVNTMRTLADCQPHLDSVHESVPNMDMSSYFNPAAVQLKVRFWVNGNGFVTQEFVTGANVVTPADQETELDYVRHLTFQVPDTEGCRSRKLEMIGNFYESRESGNEWSTVFEIRPRYALEDGRAVQNH